MSEGHHPANDPSPDDGRRPWPRRLAIVFCIAASIVGWIAVAGIMVGVMSQDGRQVANERDSSTGLSDIAPAGGPKDNAAPPPEAGEGAAPGR